MAQEPDIDVGAITEALNNKVDTDVGNVNATGSTQIANYASPSDSYINVTLSGNSQTEVAPADGYYMAKGDVSAANTFTMVLLIVYPANTSLGNIPLCDSRCVHQGVSGISLATTVPCSKGQRVYVQFNNISENSNKFMRFVYAKGSEPQA